MVEIVRTPKLSSYLPGALEEAETYLRDFESKGIFSRKRANKVMKVIEGFESPYGMGVLSSVHWVTKYNDKSKVANVDQAIHVNQKWNDRKARMIKPPHVRIAWQRLIDESWIGA